MEKRSHPHAGATGAAGCKSVGADGCKSSGRRKSNLRQRRDARGSEAESAGGWSSAAAVQRIPHPASRSAPGPGKFGPHTVRTRLFQLRFLLWKNPATGSPASREMLPPGLYRLGGSRHRRVRVQGVAGSSPGSSRVERCPRDNVPRWAVLLWDGGVGVSPSMGTEGDPIQPPAVLSPQHSPRARAVLPCAPISAQEKHFRLQELTLRVCGHHVGPLLRALQHPAHAGSWKTSLLLQTPCLAGRPKKSLSLIFPALPDSTYCLGGDFFTTTTTPGCQGDLQEVGWGQARNSEQPLALNHRDEPCFGWLWWGHWRMLGIWRAHFGMHLVQPLRCDAGVSLAGPWWL